MISKITSNLKSGVNTTLGAKTIIVGANGIGKSSIVNAIELATSGIISDVAGRVLVKRDADLMLLASEGTGELWARAEFRDGEEATWSCTRNHKSKRTGPESYFPLRDVREAILGSPETARKFFLTQVAGGVSMPDILRLIPNSLHPTWVHVCGRGEAASPVAQLTEVLEAARAGARDSQARAKAARALQPGLAQGAASPPTDAALAEAKTELAAAQTAFAEVEAFQNLQTATSGLTQRIELGRARLVQAKAAMAAAELALTAAQAQPTPLAPAPLGQTARDMASLLVAMLSSGTEECYACGAGVTKQAISARCDAVSAAIVTHTKASAAAHAHAEGMQRLRFDVTAATADVTALSADLARLETFVGLRVAPKLSAAQAVEWKRNAETKFDALNQAATSWHSVKAAEETALFAERETTTWKQLADACASAVAALLDTSVVTFQKRVQAFLPPGDRFGLRLRDGERECLQFGLMRGTDLHPALSGAEWARVTSAIAMACVKENQPAIIVPEERAFDPETLAQVLEAFTTTPAQVILTSPVMPARVPNGWMLIDLNAQGKPVVNRAPLVAKPVGLDIKIGKKRGPKPKSTMQIETPESSEPELPELPDLTPAIAGEDRPKSALNSIFDRK